MVVSDAVSLQAWVDHEWLRLNRLTIHNALDYMLLSVWHSNSWLKQQYASLPIQEVSSVVKQYVKDTEKCEYELMKDESKDPLFVIKKQRRGGRKEVVAIYYILDGVIYQAPAFTSVLRARATHCARHLQKAYLSIISKYKWTANEGHIWDFDDEDDDTPAPITLLKDGGKMITSQGPTPAVRARELKEIEAMDGLILALYNQGPDEISAADVAAAIGGTIDESTAVNEVESSLTGKKRGIPDSTPNDNASAIRRRE